MEKTVYILDECCIACGSCQDICPEVFGLNEEDGRSRVIKPVGGPEDLIEEAMDACPMECILWED